MLRLVKFWNDLQSGWCSMMHPDPTWPINGHYRCARCNRRYPVPWESSGPRNEAHHGPPIAAGFKLSLSGGLEVLNQDDR